MTKKKTKREATCRKITCVLNGDGSEPFNISYIKGITIQELKEVIHARRFSRLKHLSSDSLKLHLIVLDDNDGTRRDVEGKVSISEASPR